MGTVWLAWDLRLSNPVALKFISRRIQGDPEALAGMRRETSRSQSLSHHHIVRIHDLHEVEGEPAFISMEYVEGVNLQELARSREHQAFPWKEVWPWMQTLCDALGHAHARGVIHRDVKPGNLMLGGDGEIKLADFGLAAGLESAASTTDRGPSGTVAYMSPQQLAGEPPAITDDLYALGACLFELLAGVPPFTGPDVCHKIALEPAPLLSSVRAQRGIQPPLPEAIEDVIQRCLSKDPANRPQSAKEVVDAARAGLAEDGTTPLEGAPWGARILGYALSRRGRLWLGAALGAILLALGVKFVLPGPTTGRASSQSFKGARVRCSSFQPPSTVNGAFDGIHRVKNFQEVNRWVSGAFIGDRSEWVAIDLGRDMRITSVAIDWELAHAKDFCVRTRTSADGFTPDPGNWTRRGTVEGYREFTRGAVNEMDHIDDVVFDFARGGVRIADWMLADRTRIDPGPPVARHVMIQATARSTNNLGVYSIWEVQIGAEPVSPTQ